MTPPTSCRKMHGWMIVKMPHNDDAERFHARKHPRLKHFDYASANYYFVTICSWNKRCLFGNAEKLNPCGEAAEEGLLQITEHFPTVKVDKYVVMPNHVHMILILQGGGPELPTVIGQYKSYVTRRIRERVPKQQVWQTSFHDHVIRSQSAYEKIWLYIDSNPQNWDKDCFFENTEHRDLVGGVMTPPYSAG